MSQPHGSDLWSEPATAGGTPTVTAARLVLDGADDWTFSTTDDADGGVEDDGTGDFTIYTTALLPGVETQLQFSAVRDDITAYEVEP